MNKINKLGMKLIDYKDEFSKDYPPLVQEAMTVALKQMQVEGLIDNDTVNYVTNGNLNKKMFLEYVGNRKEYSKSADELSKEYEAYRLELQELLELHELKNLGTEISVEKEALIASKSFNLNEQFLMEYFGVTEKEMTKLLKRGGFIEIFISLRLSKIFRDIAAACTTGISHIKVESTLPYVGDDGDGYNIDINMEINVEDFTKMEWREKIWEEMERVYKYSDKFFKQKMIL